MLYETIRGKVAALFPDYTVIETGGIGYKVFIPINLFSRGLIVGKEAYLFLSHVVREDSQKLYGFPTLDERNFFEKLCTISGVGPKTALALLGHMENAELKAAIEMGNASLLCRIPGIGKKTAERIIVDLGDTIHKWRLETQNKGSKSSPNLAIDALQALLNLGYNRATAQKAVAKVLEESKEKEPPLSTVITSALKHI